MRRCTSCRYVAGSRNTWRRSGERSSTLNTRGIEALVAGTRRDDEMERGTHHREPSIVRTLGAHAIVHLGLRTLAVSALLLASFGIGSAQYEWVLWTKSSELWTDLGDSPSGRRIGTFASRDECLSRMEQVMSQTAAWLNRNGIHTTREGDTLHLQIRQPPDPSRLGTMKYSCVPNTG